LQRTKKQKSMRTIELKEPLNVNFSPRDVKFPKYLLPDTLGKAEAEEIAARYIIICQEKNKWDGISLRDFAESLDNDAKNIEEVSKETTTIILIDRWRMGGPNFAEIGFQYLNSGDFIRWEEKDGENYFLPTEKLLKAIEKYAS